jgi:hypothetical protein
MGIAIVGMADQTNEGNSIEMGLKTGLMEDWQVRAGDGCVQIASGPMGGDDRDLCVPLLCPGYPDSPV